MTGFILAAAILCSSAVSAAPGGSPEAQMDALLKTLQAKKYDGAFEDFFAGSMTAQQKPNELKAMGGQAKAAFEFLGPPTSWEVVDTIKKGKDFVLLRVVSKHRDEVPVFWNAMFYRRSGKWEPLAVFFFDDPVKAGFFQ